MKTSTNCLQWNIIALTVLLLSIGNSKAQTPIGLFLTGEDFKVGKMSYTNGCKIKIRDFSFHKGIKVTCGSTAFQVNKDSVYGYQNKEGAVFRFYKKTIYTLLNKGEQIQLYKVLNSGATKYESATYSYFFSKDFSSAVFPLTIYNLEEAFRDDTAFISLIELRFRSDDELLEYDSFHKKYKINCLLEMSKNPK